MKTIRYTILAMACMAITLGCNKEIRVNATEKKKELNQSKIYKPPSTPAEKLLVENLGKLTKIFKTLYNDSTNLKLVNAAIFSKAYTDESVLLKDLIYPINSRLNQVKKFKTLTHKWNINLTIFAAKFWKEVSRTPDVEFAKFLAGLNVPSTEANIIANADETNAGGDDVSIYFPYSDEFLPTEDELNGGGSYAPITTLVTATADADEGWGTLPYYMNGIFQYNTQVMVNDDYAAANPTHIIGVNGIEPYEIGYNPQPYIAPGSPIDVSDLVREVKQVYIGDVRCKKKWFKDALISINGNGGGNEIVFTRSDGFLKVVDGQVQETADVFKLQEVYLSRRTIRNGDWVEASRSWDGDWESENRTQNLAIFEQDNRNEKEISGEVSTTVKLLDLISLTIAPVKYKVTFKSDDTIIEQTDFKRDVFFTLNRLLLDQPYRGWPVRSPDANVSFTFWDRTLF